MSGHEEEPLLYGSVVISGGVIEMVSIHGVVLMMILVDGVDDDDYFDSGGGESDIDDTLLV